MKADAIMETPEMNNRWERGTAWDTTQRMEVRERFKGKQYFVVCSTADREEKCIYQ